MELTAEDHAAFVGRSARIDYAAKGTLHHLGTYRRDLPTNLERMIENAYDWEHLPFVHPSSFAGIALVEQGSWGWRCKTELPGGAGTQLVELLVDRTRHYWATTVVGGMGEGTQIHTQACARDEGGITVEVGFYLPNVPETEEQAAFLLQVLSTQYAQLYDEDETLMSGRQDALDERRALRDESAQGAVDLGPEPELDRSATHKVLLGNERAVVRYTGERWVAHAARCPHALGPLNEAAIQDDGAIVCPWHGYAFSLGDGSERQRRCRPLRLYEVTIENGRLLARS